MSTRGVTVFTKMTRIGPTGTTCSIENGRDTLQSLYATVPLDNVLLLSTVSYIVQDISVKGFIGGSGSLGMHPYVAGVFLAGQQRGGFS